jgi:hypothetical protein
LINVNILDQKADRWWLTAAAGISSLGRMTCIPEKCRRKRPIIPVKHHGRVIFASMSRLPRST